MTQRDYEEQPEAADLGEYVQQDSSQTLTGPPSSDALDAGYVPPDRPYALDDDTVTGGSEDLDGRLRRERPDISPDDPAGGVGGDPERSGRLAPAAGGADGGYDQSMDAVDVGISGGAASAEEAAVHERGDSDIGAVERQG